ncbi:891_t:CDS:2 [Ambispora gerdemannii]|uniref:histidine--tRNA ligase n=1 Tax=Ambispora gerdemannii TaxID=144530 RepID=A0A9N9FZY2_9GLOM|nr:891_t:CDS:2 [Ambispora gerdemannii]
MLRGLDYYTGLVFEVNLEGEKALLGGGRYDKLYQEIGGINSPALGFAVGIERLVDYLEFCGLSSELLKDNNRVDIFFFAAAPEAYLDILIWKEKLENYLLAADYNLEQ